MATHTGLRAADLTRLEWPHVGLDEIRIPTQRSGLKTEAASPLYADLKAILAGIPRRHDRVLTNEKGRLWKDGVNGSSFRNARDDALPGKDLHFHDMRWTAATKFHSLGLDAGEIAELMAWEKADVEKILARYVGRKAKLERIKGKLEGGKKTPKFKAAAKPSAKPRGPKGLSAGAGGGNRTRTKSLGSFQATTTSRPRKRGAN